MWRYGLWLAVLLTGALALSLLYDRRDLLSPESAAERRERTLPHTYLDGVRSLSFGEAGNLQEIREALRIENFARRDEALMVSPRYYSHNGGDKTWSAAADRGRYQPGARLLTLSDNVTLNNDASGGRLQTSEMTIDLQAKTARSSSSVTITQGPHRTTADGLFADLERERLELEPDVESVYVQSR